MVVHKQEIFYYKINKTKIIYFWHEIIKFKNTKFVIGGWHSNSRKLIYFMCYML